MSDAGPIKVVDVFAGPGGLGEGFSALRDDRGSRVFSLALSIEKDTHAHRTLLLRAFLRHFPDREWPIQYYEQLRSGKIDWELLADAHPEEARKAEAEVWQAELGQESWPPREVDRKIRNALVGDEIWVLIGGPPCQVYSQVGRSRIRGESRWHFARDERHLLYKEYLRIIEVHRPPIFVMENVKGLLSSKKAGKRIIEQIVADLRRPDGNKKRGHAGYTLHALAEYQGAEGRAPGNGDDPAKYIIRCERHGIPQARHRLILLGIRGDITAEPRKLEIIPGEVDMWKAVQDLPILRSRLSRTPDSDQAWIDAVRRVLGYKSLRRPAYLDTRRVMSRLSSALSSLSTGGEYLRTRKPPVWNMDWLFDERLQGVCNHTARSHIPQDLWRYFYAACFAKLNRRSPVLKDFPYFLLPAHKNVKGKEPNEDQAFADRFRVQVKHLPSTTVTSHIGKDGHYFIHPDPLQCRSLTVREAARLQTFPDNYFFTGTRTAQYQQIGNAVPPLLAKQIAAVVSDLLKRL